MRQNFRRSFSNDRSRSRERSLTARGNGNRRYDSQNVNVGLEVDQIQELLQTYIGLDVLDTESMTTLLMNVQT